MSVFSRLTDIINSNISALLDKAEDPEKMVRLIIQEMEDTLVEVRSATAKILAEKKDYQRTIEFAHAKRDDWQQKAELAVAKNREDLAKQALIEKQKVITSVALKEQELILLNDHLAKLTADIDGIQTKITEAKARQKSIVLRKQTASTRLEVKKTLNTNKIDDAMLKFEKYERKIGDLEAEVASYELGQNSLNAEFAQLEASDMIEAELKKLKEKVNNDKINKE